jgi:2-dehydro-3-deoxygluconokinase
MKKVLCFGELLLRFPFAGNGSWTTDSPMQVFIGGAELNVARALAKWNLPVKYFTALPDNFITKDIVDYLQQKNIDTSAIEYSGDRIGVYYLKEGADIKGASTVFDRQHSSFATLKTGIVDWEKVFEDVSWFHFSAIAAAVSEEAAALCEEALKVASKKNITISVDLNYRALLWKYGKSPIEIMPNLVKYCHVVMGNIWAANTLLGIAVNNNLNEETKQEDYLAHAAQTAQAIFKQFPACKYVANTFRFDANGKDVNYYAALNTIDEHQVSPLFKTNTTVDKVGSGDCFMAGLIYGILKEHTFKKIINFAAAAAFGKLQERGDATNNSVEEINNILETVSSPSNTL